MKHRRPLAQRSPRRDGYVTRCGTCNFTCLCHKLCMRCCYCSAPAVGEAGHVEAEPMSSPSGVWWDRNTVGRG